MNTTAQLSGTLQSAFDHPTRGVVGLVEDLLRFCPEQGLHLKWQGDHCRVRSPANSSELVLDRPLRKSVFRAILARVALLCNDRIPNSVSPYGGHGELLLDSDPPAIYKVTFKNTSDEQELEMIPVTACASVRRD